MTRARSELRDNTGLAQTYPNSLLSKLVDGDAVTDGVMASSVHGQPLTITIDRDPSLFAHVLKAFDTPLLAAAEDSETLRKEQDFYGVPSSQLLPAELLRTAGFRREERLVSCLVDRLGKLLNDTMEGEDRILAGTNQLSFFTYMRSDPTPRQIQFVLCEDWQNLPEKSAYALPPHIQQPLQTRLRSLGYGVSFERFRVITASTKLALSWVIE